MNSFEQSDQFKCWLQRLKDLTGKAKILVRIKRAEAGNFGVVEPVGEGVYEMKIDFGPGYRVYYAREGSVTYLLLLGGDKSTQANDIKSAKNLWLQRRSADQ
jgi:putative addiction module killer protein